MKKIIILLSTLVLVLTSCSTTENKNAMIGTGLGAASGAVLGGLLGKGKGAAIGAVLGGAIGGYVGHRMDKQARELEQIAETKRTDQGLVTKLKSDILFDTGKADLKPQARESLVKMAEIMKKYPENVLTIKGHTDSTGKDATNLTISENRAIAVKAQLVAAGMPSSVISTTGMGSSQPIADNKTVEGKKQNRRVEIEITVDESKVPKQNS